MSKERDVEILEYRIAEIEKKIIIYHKFNISVKKIEKLETLKLKNGVQLVKTELL